MLLDERASDVVLKLTPRGSEILALMLLVSAVSSFCLLSEANVLQIIIASSTQENGAGESPSPSRQKINISVLVFADGNKPIQDAIVTIIGGSTPYSTKTDKTGLRTIKDFGFNASKSYSIKIEAKGYNSEEKSLLPSNISAGNVREEFHLAKVGSGPETRTNADLHGNTNGNSNTNSNTGTSNANNARGGRSETESSLWSLLVDHWLMIVALTCVIAAGLYGLMQGYRVAVYNVQSSSGPILKRLEDSLCRTSQSVKKLELQQLQLTVKIDNVLGRVDEGKTPQRPLAPASGNELIEQRSTDSLYGSENLTLATVPYRSLDEWARRLYRILITNVAVSPEPIYLNADAISTPADMIEERKVVLHEVNNNQGAFALFSDDGNQGLVFPNPILAFRPLAFRSVFPDLTEDKFNHAKAEINPVRVSRVSDNRWRVGY